MATSALQATLTLNKKLLRKKICSTLQGLSNATVHSQSQAVVARLFNMPAFRHCQRVSCYLSMPTGEVDTAAIVQHVLDSGKELFVPKIDKTSVRRMDVMKIYDKNDLTSLPSGVWGIKEPDDRWNDHKRLSVFDEASEPLDIVLLPGVAFDRSLSRLGHGKGYYDYFVSTYVSSGRKRPLLIALALREQVLDIGEVPMGEHDWRMDAIITPDELISTAELSL